MPKVFIVGGEGFIGYHASKLLVERGYDVCSASLHAHPPPNFTIERLVGDIFAKSDDEIIGILSGFDAFVYAAGADERTVPYAPASKYFYDSNILPTQRMVRLAAAAGVKKFVLYSSYYLEFIDKWPDLEMMKEAYPRTRAVQEEVAMLQGESSGISVCSLRIPYVFGSTPNKPSVWGLFWDMIQQPVVCAPMGSTACVTVRQLAQATVGAVERGAHNGRYALCGGTITFQEFFSMYAVLSGRAGVPVIALPAEQLAVVYKLLDDSAQKQGLEHGIHMTKVAEIQSRNASLPEMVNAEVLGYEVDDIHAAIRESIQDVARAKTQ